MGGFNTWAGVITGTLTPFVPGGGIDWASLEGHMERLRHSGISALLANAMMAEGPHLTVAERSEVVRFMVARAHGAQPIIATIFGVNTEDAAEQALQAARAGAQALLVFPHPAFAGTPLDPAIPAAYFRAIWQRSSLPMIVFRLPGATAPSLDLEALMRLAETPGVAAVKDTVADLSFYDGAGRQFLRPDSPLKVLVDNDASILDFLRKGAHGVTSICATVQPEPYVRLFEHAGEPGADEIERSLRIFSDRVFDAPRRNFRARLKHALVLDGVLAHDGVRAPLPRLTEAEKAAVSAALRDSRAQLARSNGLPEAALPAAWWPTSVGPATT